MLAAACPREVGHFARARPGARRHQGGLWRRPGVGIVENYPCDVMNFRLAAENAAAVVGAGAASDRVVIKACAPQVMYFRAPFGVAMVVAAG